MAPSADRPLDVRVVRGEALGWTGDLLAFRAGDLAVRLCGAVFPQRRRECAEAFAANVRAAARSADERVGGRP